MVHFVRFQDLPCKRVLLYSLAFLPLFIETLIPVLNINKKSTSRVIVGINISLNKSIGWWVLSCDWTGVCSFTAMRCEDDLSCTCCCAFVQSVRVCAHRWSPLARLLIAFLLILTIARRATADPSAARSTSNAVQPDTYQLTAKISLEYCSLLWYISLSERNGHVCFFQAHFNREQTPTNLAAAIFVLWRVLSVYRLFDFCGHPAVTPPAAAV